MGRKGLLFLAAFLTLSLCAARADSVVVLGSDYFQTQPGTFFNFGPGIGVVNFKGLPIGPGNTDTIVERLANATINGAAIGIQLMALSLQSSQPVIFNGQVYEVYITLNPADLSKDTGTLQVFGSTTGGTFDSSLNVYFLAKFVPVRGGQTIVISGDDTLTQTGGRWSPTPPPHAVLVRGPVGDQNANFHINLAPGQVDFFPSAITEVFGGGLGQHVVKPTIATPEPSTLLLTAPALVGLLLRWKLRRT